MCPTKPIERVQRLKLADSVAEQLERLITEGSYSIGDKLPPERVLADEFGVGRSSMREALRMVEANGLLRTDHGVGVFVISDKRNLKGPADMRLTGDYTVSDLFEVRLALECKAAGLAAGRIDEDERDKLLDILEKAGVAQISDAEFVQLDKEFHKGISGASGNPLLLELSKSIGPLFEEYSHQVIGLPGRRETAHAGHLKILDAVLAGDPEAAQEAVTEHLREVEQDIIHSMGS
ncbi:FadR/GntR family transcriptional regulator [Arthrobacter sp. Marseille-P9274]|uniref:FadR/GntR family transcriptional regulator n=1 Tax=Arthrobacter sp. Marseille-P9274 TaxID=2866572 RepID=UPI0021CA8044|nr:FadR/GntR family transcriptional regulator [Arthrobacter sp. Marseille-P9274]